jgi:hypothetical protein
MFGDTKTLPQPMLVDERNATILLSSISSHIIDGIDDAIHFVHTFSVSHVLYSLQAPPVYNASVFRNPKGPDLTLPRFKPDFDDEDIDEKLPHLNYSSSFVAGVYGIHSKSLVPAYHANASWGLAPQSARNIYNLNQRLLCPPPSTLPVYLTTLSQRSLTT